MRFLCDRIFVPQCNGRGSISSLFSFYDLFAVCMVPFLLQFSLFVQSSAIWSVFTREAYSPSNIVTDMDLIYNVICNQPNSHNGLVAPGGGASGAITVL